MSVRNDFIYDMQTSPRLIVVAAPSAEITIQDLHDTLVSFQDTTEGGQYPRLILSAGKENLGGGVQVGITSTLQDAELAFEARTGVLQSGSATSSDPIILTDTTATFLTNLVGRGDLVINESDSSQATVISVASETQLTTTPLTGGTSNDFQSGDVYSIYDVVQCNITGGNLVAVDNVGAELDPVFPTFGTQIVRAASSSATTQNQASLDYSTFNNAVNIDVNSGITGTDGVKGNGANPVNNLADALIIAANRSFGILRFHSDYTFTATDVVDEFQLEGDGSNVTTLNFIAGASTEDITIINASFSGTLDGGVVARTSDITNAIGMGSTTTDTILANCTIEAGTLTIRSSNTRNYRLLDCNTGGATADPILDVNGSLGEIAVHRYSGGLVIKNVTGAVALSLDTVGGRITLDSTCTAGNIVIRGNTQVIDNSGPGCTVLDETASVLNWEHIIEPTYTAEEVMRIMSAALDGKLSGAETTTVRIRDVNDTKDRVVATVDADGNRTAVTYDATP